MKTTAFVGISILLIVGAVWIWHARQQSIVSNLSEVSMADKGDNETYQHKLARYRAGADAALRTECTNVVTGLRTIIQQRTETYDNNFTKWSATATVEFINVGEVA